MRVPVLTALAMLAFAGNSLLCRLAFTRTAIDAATFCSIRLTAGAVALAMILQLRAGISKRAAGDWRSASALFVYAAGFSWAYLDLSTATGALLLFGSVQLTMIGAGLWRGERLRRRQSAGLLASCVGLAALLLPGARAPSWSGALLMIGAGAAWGVYSLRGKGADDPLAATAGNFWRAGLLSLAMSALAWHRAVPDPAGLGYAVASGAMASGIGYAIWYAVVPRLAATSAAAVQLSVPVIAALGGIAWLGEPISWRLAVTSVVVLGGVAMVVIRPPASGPSADRA